MYTCICCIYMFCIVVYCIYVFVHVVYICCVHVVFIVDVSFFMSEVISKNLQPRHHFLTSPPDFFATAEIVWNQTSWHVTRGLLLHVFLKVCLSDICCFLLLLINIRHACNLSFEFGLIRFDLGWVWLIGLRASWVIGCRFLTNLASMFAFVYKIIENLNEKNH